MFATLGEITFELLSSPLNYESTYRWTYAEHEVVEARPRLQWIAEELRTISIELRFHASFTDPTAQLGNLLAAADSHNAQALVLGNGDHQGYFVMVALRVTSTVMTALGDIVSMTVHLEMKEWAVDSETNLAAVPQPNFIPIAIVPAPEGDATSQVTYSGALGVAATISPPSGAYTASSTGAPGVSPILVDLPAAGTSSPLLIADDVSASAIVRSSS
jgi:phage protein U